MDIDRLRYFTVVAATSSLTRAADMLGMSQPALSKAMRTLEREVGTPLLQRRGRGIELTEQGRRLAVRIAPLLDELGRIPAELAADRTASRAVRWASHESFGTYFTRLLLEHHPDAALEHHYRQPGQVEAAVADGSVDLGVTYLAVPTDGVIHVAGGTLRMGVYGRPAWARRSFDAWRFAAPVVPATAASTSGHSLDGWPDERVRRIVQWRVTHTETALELCRQGRAVACFPAFLVELHNQDVRAGARLEPLAAPRVATTWGQRVHIVHRAGDAPEHLDLVRRAVRAAARFGRDL